MQLPKYLSPSQASLFFSDREEYYLRYLAANRLPRLPQTEAMALGGAFDSHLKRALAKRYLSPSDARLLEGGEYDLSCMLDHAIEPHLDRAKLTQLGRLLFDGYISSGAWERLLRDMDNMDAGTLCMEQAVYYTCPETGLCIMGKPDIAFKRGGVGHVYDAKVNGFYSKAGASPIKNHIWNSYDGFAHLDAVVQRHACGTLVDVTSHFVEDYVRQISTYSWALFGRDSYVIGGIEQLACKVVSPRARKVPTCVVGGVGVTYCSTRAVIGDVVMSRLYEEYLFMWQCLTSGYIFDGVVSSRAESDDLCVVLEGRANAVIEDPEWAGVMRG